MYLFMLKFLFANRFEYKKSIDCKLFYFFLYTVVTFLHLIFLFIFSK